MWAENTGWISLSCENTNSCGTASYGVLNNGHGRLRGFAWGESIGWISFSCANTGHCAVSDYGVKTGWCQSTVAPPTGGPNLHASRSGGDVTLSQLTLAGGVTHGSVLVSGTPEPAPGDGYWYLARAANCKGKGTFDSGAVSQSGSRDAEIAASGAGCP